MKRLNINNPVSDAIGQFLTQMEGSLTKDETDTEHNHNSKKPIPLKDRPKADKNGKELKRKRYNLLLLPSLYENIEKIAYVENIRANEAINRALALYRDANKNKLAKYDEIERLKVSDEAVKDVKS